MPSGELTTTTLGAGGLEAAPKRSVGEVFIGKTQHKN
jgi:hypothetical protein